MKKTTIYFFGLLLLTAGIFILHAQNDNVQPAGNDQPSAVKSNAVVESAGENGADETAQTASGGVSPAVSNPAPSAAESPAVSVETNVTDAPTPAEVKPGQSEINAPAGAEKETSKEEKTPDFEIDRAGMAGKGMNGQKTGKTSETVKEPAAEEKPTAAEPKSDQKAEWRSVAGEQGKAGKDLTPEELLAAQEEVRRQANEIEGMKKFDQACQEMDRDELENALKSFQEALSLIPERPQTLKIRQKAKRSATECEARLAKGAARRPLAGKHDAAVMMPEELLAVQEEVRRQAKEIEGLKKLDQAYQEMSRKEFENALKSFNEVLSVMPVRPYTVETRQKAMRSEAECAYRLALKSYLEGNVKGAQAGINRALEFYPAHRASARLNERIKQDEARRLQMVGQPILPKTSPAYLDKQKTIKAELRRGREYVAIKEYNSAENEFRSVLADDKLNPEASANLKQIAEKRYNLETDEFKRMKAEMLSQIRDTWTPPVKRIITGPRAGTEETIFISQARRRLQDKLNNITIEKIDFRSANIVDVIGYLHQQSVVSDRDPTPGEKGVNIILNLRRPGEAAAGPAAPAAPAAEAPSVFDVAPVTPAAGTAETSAIPSITLTLTRISLMQALKYITECSGLKYRIEENVVVIFPADVAYGELETRTYKVQPSIVETFMGGAAEGAGDKLEVGGGGLGVGTTTERKDMKQFFINAGIPFPEGTSIVYIPGQTLLIVKNTPENLENFEHLLNKLNVPPVQVEIEARFVEIGQDDLEEIGLEWLLTDNWELAQKQSGLPPSMRERIQMNKNQITKGLRNLATGTTVSPGGAMAGIVSISSILTNPELSVILHALEQRDGANLLSAPKVTTKSGASAEIKVVEELIYPTEYEVHAESFGTTTSGNQSLVRYIVTPAGFETRDTGVILQVTPTVGPDNETIDLAMVPQVVELARWQDYGYDMPTELNNTQHVPINQPVFHARSITTSISIWDGQTVVMGGLITEVQLSTEDKIPLLGDIPLLGYLFRSKTSRSVKKNLLIFVTANLVDPAGNKIKKETAVPLASAAGVASATP